MSEPTAKPNPYARHIRSVDGKDSTFADIYNVLDAFEVPCHARGHAIKKLLCAGSRGAKGARQDMEEAITAIRRSIELLPDGE